MEEQTIKQLKCTRCGHVWYPRSQTKPKFCASCNSPYWNRPRRIPKESDVGGLTTRKE